MCPLRGAECDCRCICEGFGDFEGRSVCAVDVAGVFDGAACGVDGAAGEEGAGGDGAGSQLGTWTSVEGGGVPDGGRTAGDGGAPNSESGAPRWTLLRVS